VDNTYSLLDLAKLLELGAQSAVVGVPGEATVVASQQGSDGRGGITEAHPMNSLDMMMNGRKR
jgi:hypothetical protein